MGGRSVLTDSEKTNNHLKEALFLEEAMAKKYAHYSASISEPKFQQMLKGMEHASRGHHKMISDQMSLHGIV